MGPTRSWGGPKRTSDSVKAADRQAMFFIVWDSASERRHLERGNRTGMPHTMTTDGCYQDQDDRMATAFGLRGSHRDANMERRTLPDPRRDSSRLADLLRFIHT